MSKYETVIYEVKDHVAKLTFNRPDKLNAMTGITFREITEALDEADRDNNVRVLIITGNGRAFCAGVDLKFAAKELTNLKSQTDFLTVGKELLVKIENLSKPVIAAINGLALAGGFEILLACDLAVAVEDAMIGDQHMKVGMFGAGGTPYRLPLLIGIRRAKELLLTGKWISGKEAERIGLVNRAVPAGEFEKAVNEMAAELADKSPTAMRLTKSYINKSIMSDADVRLEAAMLSAIVNDTSEDHDEALKAFGEKRKPEFTGR
ncbi:MAG: enoyl-CoA hydratase/isomerase family protein [Desulfatiglans sp.]|jgi:enoyl-CoA hydratase/carnithine racemase|nr:enoyl-CoA hydratase/isomerase family protein [Desulfatiglans sp.]